MKKSYTILFLSSVLTLVSCGDLMKKGKDEANRVKDKIKEQVTPEDTSNKPNEKHIEEVRTRWNQSANGITIKGEGDGKLVDFIWRKGQEFPTAKSKGLDIFKAEVKLAEILVKFLDAGDNFKFLSEKILFETNLNLEKIPKVTVKELVNDSSETMNLDDKIKTALLKHKKAILKSIELNPKKTN